MLRLFPYITLGLLVYILLVYMQNYDPDAFTNAILSVDQWGITTTSRKELERKDKIMRLETDAYGRQIGSAEKTVLLNHTVFIGASALMVEYALGPPALPPVFKNSKLYYVYFLTDDKRPTVFQFDCALPAPSHCDPSGNYQESFGLSKAYKKSTIDLDNLDPNNN